MTLYNKTDHSITDYWVGSLHNGEVCFSDLFHVQHIQLFCSLMAMLSNIIWCHIHQICTVYLSTALSVGVWVSTMVLLLKDPCRWQFVVDCCCRKYAC